MFKREKLQTIKYAPPPPELPVYQNVNPKLTSFFGRTNYIAPFEEKRFIFGIKRTDRKRHIYFVGKSGVGKSKLMELLIRQDIAYGYGVCLIDPRGDIFNEILNFIPENRIKDTVVIDPSDTFYPVSFNPLSNVSPDFKHQLTQSLIEVMEKQFGANWTPLLEYVFRFTTLALLDYPYATIRGMILMLTDENYRQRVIQYIENDMVKRFFSVEFTDWSKKFDTDAIIPLVNKLGQFLSNPMLRNIFGQKENKIDLENLINDKKIILINLSKEKFGEENANFFGSMFIIKIKQAGTARASITENKKEDFYLYIDEFQNFSTETFENILNEAIKYGLCLSVSHQYIGQLLPKAEATVLGNVGTIIVFRVGGEDAAKLEQEMTPTFKAKDIINLGAREFYIKMIIDGQTYDPFSAETLKVLPQPHKSFKEEVIKSSREKYAVPVETVKKLIAEENEQII